MSEVWITCGNKPAPASRVYSNVSVMASPPLQLDRVGEAQKIVGGLNGYSSAKLAVIDAPAAGGVVNFSPGTVLPKKKVEPKL